MKSALAHRYAYPRIHLGVLVLACLAGFVAGFVIVAAIFS